MPTPFTHLLIAQRLLRDKDLPASYRSLLDAERGAFLLGSVAADARVGAGLPREHTHFYAYSQELNHTPWRLMMARNPALWQPRDEAQRAFVAGYIAHLAVDEYWSRYMMTPHFWHREWGDRSKRVVMLHAILIYMDERDLPQLEPWQAESLDSAQPDQWIPFISDDELAVWQQLIYDQIKPDGISQTLEIFGARISWSVKQLRELLDSDARMHTDLWEHVPRSLLAEVETGMYRYALEQMRIYMDETSGETDR
jgi:hypothetical protein